MYETPLGLCPCCGKVQVGLFDTCPECGWCNDYANTIHPDKRNLANNEMSLNEARAAYRAKQKNEPANAKAA